MDSATILQFAPLPPTHDRPLSVREVRRLVVHLDSIDDDAFDAFMKQCSPERRLELVLEWKDYQRGRGGRPGASPADVVPILSLNERAVWAAFRAIDPSLSIRRFLEQRDRFAEFGDRLCEAIERAPPIKPEPPRPRARPAKAKRPARERRPSQKRN